MTNFCNGLQRGDGVELFVIADLHFGDEATCTRYRRPDGTPLRPFPNADEMGREIIRRWNEIVGTHDVVYVLGDVGRGPRTELVRQLRGRKHLIAGNGDDLDALGRAGLFASISVAKRLPGVLLTHIPVHPSELRGQTVNIHGHLHARSLGDRRYVCVSVEQTDFRPIPLSTARDPIHATLVQRRRAAQRRVPFLRKEGSMERPGAR